jgi:DNA polymerase
VSPSVKGVDTEKQPTKKSNGKVETTSSLPLGTRFTKALTDGDASRHIEGTSSGTLSDLSRCVTVCQSPLFLDFETRNTGGCKLDTAGGRRYADDPATEILTLIYQNGDGEPRLWTPAMQTRELAALAADPTVTFVCFGDFELVIWNRIMTRFGFPAIPTARWIDARASCSYLALPRALGKLLPVLGANVIKDDAGRRLVLSLSRPNRKTGKYPEITPEVLERVSSYNKIDVDGLAAIHSATEGLSERERQIWELDQTINRRGIGVDTDFVRAAKRIAERSKGALFEEFAGLTKHPERTDDPGLSPHQVTKTRKWLKSRGFTLENLESETVEDALKNLVLPDVKRVLQIRLITAPTSLTKLDAMLACAGSDDRARGLFQYHAATTGRRSATLIQPQNLPRPTIEIDPDEIEELVTAVKTGDPAALARWGEPVEVLMSALRFALVAADGAQFGVGDFSMIETCVLLALAGQHDKCKLIANGVDVYRDMAATVYGLERDTFLAIPKNELTREQQQQRHIGGKNPVLACGYQLGPDTFRRRYLRHMEMEEGKKFAEETVYTHYRKNWAPRVPMLWRDLERTARRAMLQRGKTATAECGISYKLETVAGLPRLVCRLLNGKHIYYQNARVSPDKINRWGYPVWTYWAYRKGQWREIEPYGGQLTENAVQALARELLVDAMFRLEARGYPVVMHCHDEIVVEHPEITEAIMQEIMAEQPSWAAELGVPIAVEAWVGRRYRK